MPRYKPSTEKAKATRLIKLHSKTGFNQTRVAELEGVSPSAINHRLNREPVQKTLQDIILKNLKQAGTSMQKVYKKNNEQLNATRTISAVISPEGKQKDANGQTCDFVEVQDWNAVDKAINRTLILVGHLKQSNGNGKGVSVINIIYDHRTSNPHSTLRPQTGRDRLAPQPNTD
jgi:predicted transcriptional regulator